MPTKRLKTRLNRKCGGSRRQVQAHFHGLRKMRPINADNSRELERKAATSVTEENNLSPVLTKHYKNMYRGVLPCVLFQSFSNMGTDVCKLIVSWTKAVVQLYVYVNEDVVEEINGVEV